MAVANSDANKRDDRRSRSNKSVEKHDCRDAQRTQDQLRKNTNAALGNIKKRDLFPGAGFQKKILALDASRLEPLPYQAASEEIWAANVRFGSKADIHSLSADVRFTPKSGHYRSERVTTISSLAQRRASRTTCSRS